MSFLASGDDFLENRFLAIKGLTGRLFIKNRSQVPEQRANSYPKIAKVAFS